MPENTNTLFISVHETICVSEGPVVEVIYERLTTWDFNPKNGETTVSIAEFRSVLGDSAVNLPEQEIKKVYTFFERIADSLFDKWVKEKSLKNAAKNDIINQY